MQPELPWNVVGIPSEAREAARAAARREGLSVGEWLTRRIFRSFSDPSDAPSSENWHQSAYRTVEEKLSASSAPSTRDTDEMLARVSRTENETGDIYRRIEEQLRAVARRLDQTDRAQAENNRAMSKAATEINIATREQAQAFDQLGNHVVGLADRIKRVEQSANNDGIKEAVKGLHQGLSRLADQISETARQSASQVATLAGNVEVIATKLADAQNTAKALELRIGELDERLNPVERTSDTLDRLATRFSSNEAETAGAVARLEEAVSRLDTRSANPGMDRRLQGIEHTLADISGRLESAERRSFAPDNVEQGLKTISAQLETADRRGREAIAELQSALKATNDRLATLERASANAAATFAPSPAAAPAVPNFDLPPFPQSGSAAAAGLQVPPPPMAAIATPAFDIPPSPAPSDALPPFAGEAAFSPFPPPPFVEEPLMPQQDPAASAESFLAAARRSARAASEQPQRSALNSLAWNSAHASSATADAPKSRTRFALIGGIVVIAAAAAIAGMMLSQSFRSEKHVVVAPAPLVSKTHVELPPPPTSDDSQQSDDGGMQSDGTAVAPDDEETTTPAQNNSVAQPAETKPVAPPRRAALSPLQQLAAAANSGNARAQLLLGLNYLEGSAPNEAEAARWLERAANQGETVAQYRLGTLYERGRGVTASSAMAMKWYLAAASDGNRKAMHNLAVIYAEGSAGKKDYGEAAKWFSRAANLGLADSQFNLAVLYERGMGVPQSLVNAYQWYAIAAAQGDSESKARVDALSTQLSPAERITAQAAATAFKPQALDARANVSPTIAEFVRG